VRERILLAVFCCQLFAASAGIAAEDLESRIAKAEELNLTASWEESQRFIDELLADIDQASQEQRAQIRFLQARNLALSGAYQEAIDLLEPLLEQELGSSLKLRIHRLAANIELQRDEFESAYRFMLRGVDLLPQVDAATPKTNLLAMMADFYAAAGEADRAIEHGARALEIARTSGDLRNICVANHDLSLAQEEAGHLEKALENRERALDFCRRAGDPVHLGASMIHLGDLLFERGRLAEAKDNVQAGIRKLQEAGFRDGVYLGKLILARILFEEGATDEAEKLLLPLVDSLDELRIWRYVSDCHQMLSRIAEKDGRYRVALEHQRIAEDADDRLLDRARAMRVAYLQVELDTRQKEQQIELLRERNRVLELRDESQRQRRYMALGGAAAATIIVFLLFALLLRTRSDRRHLLWLSQHDGLTGLTNHTSFFRRANEALAVCTQSRQPFTLITADIDYFKNLNDEFGHDMGDCVLRRIGELMQEVFWPQGIVGRVGGEEFAIALAGMERERAMELIQEFDERLGQIEEIDTPITLSYGIAETLYEISVERLRRLGDQALYEAKRRGRNQVVDASEISDEAAIQVPMNRRADDPK